MVQPRRYLRLKNHKDPTIDINFSSAKIADDDERRFQMIRPAENYESISVNYDPLMQYAFF